MTSGDRPRGKPVRPGRLSVGILLVATATGYLVYKATGDNLTYYREVDELLAATDLPAGEKIRLSGDVVEGSIVRSDASRAIRFEITETGSDGGSRIPVAYEGTVPDIFKPGIQVVVEGRLEESGTFQAHTLLAKCPSKYQAAGELNEPEGAARDGVSR
ncbi:MAG: cytochrome c maturation protein CcmE [Gemmatimonadetes bacterium]|nr:cytochrome c maturation protein CcmE [Gemmatimonadota bacterium]